LIFGGAGGPDQYLMNRQQLEAEIVKLQNNSSSDPIIEAEIRNLSNQATALFRNTSFSPIIWAYHTITDTWVQAGLMTQPTQVVTSAVIFKNQIVIPGGELAPGVRTTRVTTGTFLPYTADFGVINYITLGAYLSLIVAMGWYFSKRNNNSDDYFLAGKRVPWWAAGLSIYATMLSAITYLSQPALAYSFDWQAYFGYLTILMMAPVVIVFYLPFYRRLNITTAYEYLEQRFNLATRMFGSVSFVLFQLARMGIVVYLPALALSTVIGMDIYLAIVLMGILAIIYTVLGGIEAVIWTDVLQVVVLLIGLVVGLCYIFVDIGDFDYLLSTAINDNKLQLIDWRWSTTEVVTWSLFLGSFALNIAPYTTDQAVVQRYLTTPTEKEAAKSIWLSGILSIPAGFLIFSMGTFLYVYFKQHPELLSIGMENDQVFPIFIANQLPAGMAGLVIAGIFSASMSSLDSSMHSVSTVVTVDFYKRFTKNFSEASSLSMGRWVTLVVGFLGTLVACIMALYPVASLFFLFQEILGLFGSAVAAVFILGVFTKRTNGPGALTGALISLMAVVWVKYATSLNFYIYPLVGIPVGVLSGYLVSMVVSPKK
jgi:SSS family transporter